MRRFSKRNILIQKAKVAKTGRLYGIMIDGARAHQTGTTVNPYMAKTKEYEMWIAGYIMDANQLTFIDPESGAAGFDPELNAALDGVPPAPVRKKHITPKANLEKTILRECKAWLTKHGIFHWRNQVGGFGLSGGGYIQFGIKGLADVTGLLPDGQFFAVECKARYGGVQSIHQKVFQQMVERNNGIYILAHSVSDLEVLVK